MTLDNMEFYIVVPAEATNEVTNPSFETATTGYTAVGAGVSIARSSTYQRRGLYSLEVTTASGVSSGVYFGTVNEVAGVSRTFSVDVYNTTAGQAMRIGIYTTGGAALTETTFTSNGYWQRISVTRTGSANTTRRLYVLRDSVASTAKFYVDGLYYSTVNGTYLDGDMKGYVKSQVAYGWNGTAHASTSWRSGQTRSGGTMLRIKDYARILSILGLGMAPVTNLAIPLTTGYSGYQDTKVNDRDFVFSLAFTGLTPGDLQDARNAIINAVRPDRVYPKQPILLRYQGLDSTGADASEPVEIMAHYVDGLQDGFQQPGIDRVNLRFTSYLPMLSKAGDSGAGLGFSTTVSNFANIGYRDTDGQWKAMGTGTNGAVWSIVPGVNGEMYAGGSFTLAGGVANTSRIAKWDGAAWTALGTGAANGTVSALAIGPDGSLYAGGSFTAMGGVANTAGLAKWDGAAWSSVSTGFGGGSIFALALGPDGALYAGGDFTTANGVAVSKIAKYLSSTWSAMGTGMTGGLLQTVNALVVGPNGDVYAGGNFTTAGGVTVNHIARWNGSTWSSLGAGMSGGGLIVNAIDFDAGGTLYAGGSFTTAGTVSASNFAIWNGTAWSAAGSGVNNVIYELRATPYGVYVGGQFTTAGGKAMADRGAVYNRGVWSPVDINVQDGAAYFYAFSFDRAGRLYLGGSWAGTSGLSATVTATVTGNVGGGAYPVIKFTGPGVPWQLVNYTTGRKIYFQGLTVQTGETITLDLRPGRALFSSSWRTITPGDMYKYIAAGSNLDWFLQSGSNNVSAYMLSTSGASSVVATWQDSYWSLDGAKR